MSEKLVVHNVLHVKIMDWEKGRVRRFVDLIGK